MDILRIVPTIRCRRPQVRDVHDGCLAARRNMKAAERFIQTSLRAWAHSQAFTSSAERTEAMRPWLRGYSRYIGGTMPSLPTVMRVAVSAPPAPASALRKTWLPGASSEASPGARVTMGVPGGTRSFFAPPW